MKLLETLSLPSSKSNSEKFKFLFKDPDFIKDISYLRDKYGIPHSGIKKFLGVTDNVPAAEQKRNSTKFELDCALTFDDGALRKMGIKRKSRKAEFDAEVKKIRLKNNLPNMYQNLLSICVRYGRWHEIPHEPCIVRVYNDDGEIRIFVEIFSHTHKNDLEKAWTIIQKCKKERSLVGGHLFRFENYYASQLKEKKVKLVGREGSLDSGYDKDNIDIYRLRKHKKANNIK